METFTRLLTAAKSIDTMAECPATDHPGFASDHESRLSITEVPRKDVGLGKESRSDGNDAVATRAFITRLPTELPIHIFYLYIRAVGSYRETISQTSDALVVLPAICRYWRTVVLSEPHLLSVLDFHSQKKV